LTSTSLGSTQQDSARSAFLQPETIFFTSGSAMATFS
jgi:hypothetical protein